MSYKRCHLHDFALKAQKSRPIIVFVYRGDETVAKRLCRNTREALEYAVSIPEGCTWSMALANKAVRAGKY
jgi:hypothetical protein